MPARSVHIQTGSRLHFGPLSHRPDCGRHFGGIGMMIQSPGVAVRVRLSESPAPINSEPMQAILDRIRRNRPEWTLPIHLELLEEIPAHQGFGSGTQLGMAVTEGIGLLHGFCSQTAKELASYSRRGQRSSVGLFGYLEGGFLVDAGHQSGEAIGQIACRFDFPTDWSVLLLTPPELTGLHGVDESTIFANLVPMPQTLTGQLSHITLTEILPSLKHTDFRAFAPAISTYGKLVGEFFSANQGGVFSHPEMEPFVDRMNDQGIQALAQSSWGPTVAIFAESAAEVIRIQAAIQKDDFGQNCSVRVTHALNSGRILTLQD